MSENVVRNDEEMLRIKVRGGYVLQIGGDFYQDGEIITTKYKNIKDQEWKVEILGSSTTVIRKSAKPEVIVEDKRKEVEVVDEEVGDMSPVEGEELGEVVEKKKTKERVSKKK